jgi:heme-degrading monooxygenase HmoA
MVVVVFEVHLDPAKGDRYFEIAAGLRRELEQVDGFISVERFKSLVTENKYLSLSTWRDEQAVEAWYNVANHKKAQQEGIELLFTDYRIRVASVLRDYSKATGRPGTVMP